MIRYLPSGNLYPLNFYIKNDTTEYHIDMTGNSTGVQSGDTVFQVGNLEDSNFPIRAIENQVLEVGYLVNVNGAIAILQLDYNGGNPIIKSTGAITPVVARVSW